MDCTQGSSGLPFIVHEVQSYHGSLCAGLALQPLDGFVNRPRAAGSLIGNLTRPLSFDITLDISAEYSVLILAETHYVAKSTQVLIVPQPTCRPYDRCTSVQPAAPRYRLLHRHETREEDAAIVPPLHE